MNAKQLAAFRSTAREYVRQLHAGNVAPAAFCGWMPADHEPAHDILDELHAAGLIDDNGLVTAAGRQAFLYNQS